VPQHSEVLPDTKVNLDRIALLEAQINRLKRSDKIKVTLLEISNAVTTTLNLDDLYASIHTSLNRLIYTPNFYISIYDREEQLLHFPYYKDEMDDENSKDIVLFEEKSLTGEVILNKKPIFLDKSMLALRYQEKRVQGSLPLIWIGVPLIARDIVIGAIAVQSYTDPWAFSQKDLDILVLVSNQIAMAIERKQIHEALKESEQRYRTLAEQSHDIIMRFDIKGRHLYVNPAVEALGVTPSEMVGKTHRELNFPKDLVGIWETAIVQVFKTEQVNRIEFKLPDGIWIDWILCPEFNSDREVISVITFARDITERKQSELHTACFDRINKIIINATDIRRMLNEILDTMIDVFDCDRSWILFPCNPDASFYDMTFMRTKPEWFLETNFRVEITPETRCLMAQVLASEGPVVSDPATQRPIRNYIRETCHVNSHMVMAVSPKLGEAWEVGLHQCSHARIWVLEEQQLFKGICQRISDGLSSMLLHQKLEQAKHYIDNVLDSMPSILMGVDPEGRITHWNKQAQTVTKVAGNQAIGRNFNEMFPELTFLTRNIKKAVTDLKVVEKTKVRHEIANQVRYRNIIIYPLTGGESQGAVIRMDDVTEQMRLDAMMVQSEKMLSIGGMAAGMAHEINNPLAGMMQNAQVIQNRLTKKMPANIAAAQKTGVCLDNMRDYMETRGINKQFEHINEAGHHAAKIVSNMLSFARKGEGKKSYENLVRLMEKTISLAKNEYNLKKKFDAKQVDIKMETADGFPFVFCEASKIQQVFFNIIKNGTEAMVTARDSHAPKLAFFIQFFVENKMAVIDISDNGPGMEEKVQKKIFEPFFTTKSPGQGTGLGLSVSYFIIEEDHQGELKAASSREKGTTFTIKLPIHG
jgi:PAS domain S-box-containing protein